MTPTPLFRSYLFGIPLHFTLSRFYRTRLRVSVIYILLFHLLTIIYYSYLSTIGLYYSVVIRVDSIAPD